MGPLGQTLGSALSQRLGGLPLGWNNPNNVYNSYAVQRSLAEHNQRMAMLGKNDGSIFADATRAVMRAANIKASPLLMKELTDFGGQTFGMAANMFLGSDEGARLYDQMTLGRGQGALGKFINDYGRFAYDQRTGSYGLSKETFERITGSIDRDFGGDKRSTRAAGLSTGELGELVRELGTRGFLGGDPGGKTGEAGISEQITKIKRALDDKVKAVAALKEVFGAAGEPNAPIPKLLNALEAMTGGSQQLSGQKMESIVRGLKTASDSSGIGLQQVSAFLEMNSKLLSAAGINSAFAAPITERQMLTHSALAQTGALGTPSWGLLSQTQLAGLQAAQETRAVGSTTANLLGAVSRLRAQGMQFAGGKDADLLRDFANEAQAGIMGKATKAFSAMDAAQQARLLATGFGMSAQSAEAELRSRDANSEFVYNTGAQAHVANMQVLEFGRRSRGLTSGIFSRFLTERGADAGRAGKIGMDLSDKLYDSLLQMDNASRNDRDKRTQALAAAARAQLLTTGGPDAAKLVNDPQALAQMVNQFYDSMNEQFKATNGVSLNNFLTLNAPEVRAAREANAKRNKVLASIQSNFAGANMSAGMRVADALLTYSSDASQTGVESVFKALNVKDSKAIDADTKKVFAGLMQSRKDLYDQYFDQSGALKGGITQADAEKGIKAGMAAIDKQLKDWVGGDAKRQELVDDLLQKQKAQDQQAGTTTGLQLMIDKLVLKTAGGKELDLEKATSEPTEAKKSDSVDSASV